MGKIAARFRPVVVDQAAVIVAQKRTRQLVQNRISVLIDFQITGGKLLFFHPEISRQTLDILIGKTGTQNRAAVGAFAAVVTEKNLLIQRIKQ